MKIIGKLKNLFQNKATVSSVKKSDTEDPFDFYSFVASSIGMINNNAYECVPAVKLAIDFITRNAAQLDLGLYDFKTNKEIFSDDRRVSQLMALLGSNSQTANASAFIAACVGYLVYRGECFILLNQTWGSRAGLSGSLPESLTILNPSEVTDYTDAQGNVVKWSWRGFTYTPDQIVHVKIFNPDNLKRGYNTQFAIQDLLKSSLYSTRSSAKFYENGAVPEFIFSTTQQLTPKQMSDLKESWEAAHKGVNNGHKVGFVSGGLEPKQLNQGTTAPQIAEAKQNEERILSYFYAQKALLNLTDTTNYATFQGQMRVFWQCTVIPLLSLIKSALNQRIVSPFSGGQIELRFKYDNVPALAEDYTAKIAQAKELVAMGWPLNAVNDRLNLGFEPVPWGDTQWINFGLMPITDYDNSAMSISATSSDNSAEGKSFQALTKEVREVVVWKKFILKQGAAEIKMAQKLGGFLQAQKERVLKNLSDGKSTNWADEETKLNNAINPLLLSAVKDGINLGRQQIPTKAINENVIAQAYLRKAASRIKKISKYTKEATEAAITDGLTSGATTEEIADTLKVVYDKARARKIARTEATGAVNGGTNDYFAEIGAKKTWLTSMDGRERESHAEINGETVDADDTFSNGLMYPGDPSVDEPDETVNCRCTLLGNTR